MTCLIKLWERVKLHMTSSFFFSNNFSILPNDNIVGRSKLEAFAEEFKLRHELFSVMIKWKTFKKKENCCLTAFSSFLSMFFQSLPSSIGLTFLNPKPSNATFLRHSQAPDQKPPVKCTNYETRLDCF